MGVRVLVDANVLFSRTLRDWLLLLKLRSGGGMFTLAGTHDILAETIAKLRDHYPRASGGEIARLHDLITQSLDERIDEFVVDGSFPGGDQGDAHVHAAAVAGGVHVLLTCDRGWLDMDEGVLAALPYEPQHPDSFFCLVDDSSSAIVRAVAAEQRDYFLDKRGQVDLPGQLRAAGCPGFARRIGDHLQSIPVPRRDDATR